MDHWIFTGIAIGIFCGGLAFAKWTFETLARKMMSSRNDE